MIYYNKYLPRWNNRILIKLTFKTAKRKSETK